MPHWVQIDLLDAIAEAEAKNSPCGDNLESRCFEPCSKWTEAQTNDYGDFTEGWYSFRAYSSDKALVVVLIAKKDGHIYYSLTISDKKGCSIQPLCIDQERCFSLKEGKYGILSRLADRIRQSCEGFDIPSNMIDKVINDIKRKMDS